MEAYYFRPYCSPAFWNFYPAYFADDGLRPPAFNKESLDFNDFSGTLYGIGTFGGFKIFIKCGDFVFDNAPPC